MTTDLQDYQYQILRYMHDRTTGEFVNVGVVVWFPDTYELEGRFNQHIGRISQFFGGQDGVIPELRSIFRHFEHRMLSLKQELKAQPVDSITELTQRLIRPDDSSLFFTEPESALGINSEETANYLYERLVERYETEQEKRHDDAFAWRQVYKKVFDRYKITPYLKSHVIRTKKDQVKFSHAWQNGKWNCFEVACFDLKQEENIKNKLYKISGKLNELASADEPLSVYILAYLPQNNPELAQTIKNYFEPTLQNHISVQFIEESKAEDFVQQVHQEMVKTGYQLG